MMYVIPSSTSYTRILRCAIDAGDDIREPVVRQALSFRRPRKARRAIGVLERNMLAKAVSASDMESAKLILGAGVCIDRERATYLLCLAIEIRRDEGHGLEFVHLMLENGGDPCGSASEPHEPMIAAVKEKDGEVVSLLLQKGASPEGKDGSLLCMAIAREDLPVVKILIEGGAVLYRRTEFSPLTCCCSTICPEELEAILDREEGRALLREHEEEMWSVFLKHARTCPCRKVSDLMAIVIHHLGVCEDDFVLEGAALHLIRHYEESTPVEEVVKVLKEGALVDGTYDDTCALHEAVRHGCSAGVVAALIMFGADVDAEDECGDSAVEIAEDYESPLLPLLIRGRGYVPRSHAEE